MKRLLSGFLITALFVEEFRAIGTIRLGSFYLRRALRLLPQLALMLAACGAYAACAADRGESRLLLWNLLTSACRASNFYWCISGWSLGMLAHTWSLCLEGQFYLLSPLVLRALLASRLSHRWTVALLTFAASAAALFRLAAWRWGGVTGYHIANASLPARADALIGGASAALVIFRAGNPERMAGRAPGQGFAWVAALILGALVVWCGPGPHLFWGGYAVAGASSAVLVAGAVAAPRGPFRDALATPALAWIGRVSYGLYLWYVPVFCVAPLILRLPGWVGSGRTARVVLCVGLTFVLAAISHYLIERPFRRWANRPSYSTTGSARLVPLTAPVTANSRLSRTPV